MQQANNQGAIRPAVPQGLARQLPPPAATAVSDVLQSQNAIRRHTGNPVLLVLLWLRAPTAQQSASSRHS